MDSDNELDDLMRDLTGEMTHVHRWLAESAGINHTDLMCLYFVRSEKGMATPKAVARHLGLTSGATAIMLNRLEQADFIIRSPHPSDRRAVLLSLGPAVEKSGLMQLRERFIRLNKGVSAGFTDVEMAVVHRFMGALLLNTRDSLRRMRVEKSAAELDEQEKP